MSNFIESLTIETNILYQIYQMKYLYTLFLIEFILLINFNACSPKIKIRSQDLNTSSHINLTATSSCLNEYYSKTNYHPTREQYFKLVHTELDIKLNWKQKQVLGEATLTIVPYFYAQKELLLDAQNMFIEAVKIEEKMLNYTYNGKTIHIDLPQVYSRYDTFTVWIKYHTKPSIKGSINPVFENQNDHKGFYFIKHKDKNFFWTQGQTSHNSNWFPTFDSPNYQTTQSLYITVDSSYKTLSNGLLIKSVYKENQRQDHWLQDKPHAPYLFLLAVGEYEIIEDSLKNRPKHLPLLYYVESDYKQETLEALKYTPEMIDFMEKLLNYTYPWDKYAQIFVREFIAGGMENTSATVLNYEFLKNKVDSLVYQRLIIHELAHQWFGNLITPESWANTVLSEGLASYMEYLWFRHKYGKTFAEITNLNSWLEYKNFLHRSKDYPLKNDYYLKESSLFGEPTYTKSALILHQLKALVGDTAFFESLSYYIHEKAYKRVELDHLRLAFEAVTGKDLTWFFDQWFKKPNFPKLYYSTNFQNGILTVKIIQKAECTYYLPTQLKIWSKHTAQSHDITLTKTEHIFRFDVQEKPKLVILDPDHVIPAEIDFIKSTQEFINQYHLSNNVWHQFEALIELKNGINENYLIVNTFLDALKHDLAIFPVFALGILQQYKGISKDEIIEKVKPFLKSQNIEVKHAAEKTYYALKQITIKDE